MLAIGPLSDARTVADYTYFDAKNGKPELFAPAKIDAGPLAGLLDDPQRTIDCSPLGRAGERACMGDRAAPDRSGVRNILVRSSLPLTTPKGQPRKGRARTPHGPRALDIDAALDDVRRVRVSQALAGGRSLSTQEIVASTGLPSSITLNYITAMVAEGELLAQVKSDNEETYRMKPTSGES